MLLLFMKLYLYTKIENLTSIVQKDKLSFWLTNYKEFDDRSEGEYILKVQQEKIQRDQEHRKSIEQI